MATKKSVLKKAHKRKHKPHHKPGGGNSFGPGGSFKGFARILAPLVETPDGARPSSEVKPIAAILTDLADSHRILAEAVRDWVRNQNKRA